MVIFGHKSSFFQRSYQRLSGIYHSVRLYFLSRGDILLTPELLLNPRLRRSVFFPFPDTKFGSANQDFVRRRTDLAPTTPLDTWVWDRVSHPSYNLDLFSPTSTCLTNQKPVFKAGDFHLTTSSNPRSGSGLEIRTISYIVLAWRISSQAMISASKRLVTTWTNQGLVTKHNRPIYLPLLTSTP